MLQAHQQHPDGARLVRQAAARGRERQRGQALEHAHPEQHHHDHLGEVASEPARAAPSDRTALRPGCRPAGVNGEGSLHGAGQPPRSIVCRDEGLLRLFFADALAPDEALELVKRLRHHAEQIERDFRTEILPLAHRASGRFPLIVAREGADYFSWRAAWFRQLEKTLTDELDARGR
jgi:Virulence activator alpha C-term